RFEHDRPYDREFEGIQKFEPISRLHESQVDILHVGRNEQAGYFYYVMELADDAAENPKSEIRNPKETPSTSDKKPSSNETLRASEFGIPSTFGIRNSDLYIPHTLKLDLYRPGRLSADECIRIGLALTTALEHLHGHRLVHRDVKPSNIIFVTAVPKLADIGLVASMDATMSFVGTSGFLPPEGPGTPQGDIYSLGKVLYEISMGRDRQEFPKLPSDLLELTNPDALVEFNEILLKACESEARRRYQSAEEMRADLEFLQRGQSIKRKRTEEQRWAVYRKVGLAVVLLAFIAILGSIGLRQFEPRPTGSRLQPSTNHEATILYDQARRIIEADDYKRYGFAWSNLNTAVQIDTNFTAAYALMSQMAIGEAWAINVEDRILTLRKLASRLMTLDSRLAESHCAESCVQFFDWEFDKAEKS